MKDVLLNCIAQLDRIPHENSPVSRAVISGRNRLVAALVFITGSAAGRETLPELLESADQLAKAGIAMPYALREES